MIFSVIEIETWKRCRRKWDLTSDNRQNLESIRLAAALVVGTAVHETLAAKTDDESQDAIAIYRDKSTAVIEKIEADYKEDVGAKMSIDEATPVYESLGIGLKMMEAYDKFYEHSLPERYKIVHTEQRAITPIPGTEHYLRGTLDTLVQDVNTGLLYVLERKTYKNRPKIDKLQNDTQMIAYEWILSQLFGAENVGGTLYDGIWKKDPNTKYYKSKYKLSDMFLRHRFIHPPEQIEEYGRYLPAIVNEMAAACQPNNSNMLYYNRRWEGCYDCGMVQLCDAMSRGEDTDDVIENYYRQRTDANRLADPED